MTNFDNHRMVNNYEKYRKIIENSYCRSEKYGVNEKLKYFSGNIEGNELQSILLKNKELLQICDPFIKILYDYVKGTGFFIEVVDKNGIILSIIGDEDIVKTSSDIGMVVGTDVSEAKTGSNAISIALIEDCAIQLRGEDHYLDKFHQFSCSCSTIHDENAKVIGCINLTGWSDRVHSHTLALVVAAVRSIENQMKVNIKQDELIEAYNDINAIVNSLDMGIIALDSFGKIKLLNYEACKILKCCMEEAIGIEVFSFIHNGDKLNDALNSGERVQNKEIRFLNSDINKKYNLDSNRIKDKNGSVCGSVLILKDMKNVYKLVNQYIGMKAQYDFDMILGNSPQINQVKEYAKRISNSPSTILIHGESGTGKELMAQAIHNNSNRKHYNFVAINCGAIPKSLIGSELFGYEEGAFTGAKKGGYPGKIALADNGTLFLDEVGEMPLDMQVNFLRFIQEGKITRLAGDTDISVNVRIIAATNKNLKEEVIKGNFREDLYYRLSVIPIYLPPLRERYGDIDILIKYFLKNKAITLGREIPKIKSDLYNKLINYDWPGNVRELENCIENIVNFNGEISYEFENQGNKSSDIIIDSRVIVEDLEKLSDWEKLAIEICLKKTNYNLTKASEILGITRTTLYNKISKYKIKNVVSK